MPQADVADRTAAEARAEGTDATSSSETLKEAGSQQSTSDRQVNGGSSDPGRGAEDVGKGSESPDEKNFEVAFGGPDDPENPKSMSEARKWLITCVVASSSLCVTTNSTIYTFTYDQIEPEFGISREVATLGLSIFVIGLGLGPLFLGPLSEFYGRRIIYLLAYAWIFIFIIPCAVAQNIQTILVTRFLDGLGASAFLSVAGGTIKDIFTKEKLSAPMMLYSGSPFIGPALGPILGGFINQYTSWRWTFWVLLIWTGCQLAVIALTIPETYTPVLLRRKAVRMRKETGDDRWYAPIEKMSRSVAGTVLVSCYRPMQLQFLEPMVLCLDILSALLLGILYLFFGAFPLIFEENHGFTLSQVGLSFLGLFIGMVLGILSDPIWRRNYQRLLRKREAATGEKGVTEPEFRLPPTIVGIQFVWVGLFLFGWTTYSSIHWIVPIIFSIPIGFGIVICYAGVFTFFVESYPLYAASALAANSFARSSFAAGFPLFGVQMYRTLGFQWATSVLAFLCLATAPFPYIFFRYGKRIRQHSKFAKG